jgi:hypothetical protein
VRTAAAHAICGMCVRPQRTLSAACAYGRSARYLRQNRMADMTSPHLGGSRQEAGWQPCSAPIGQDHNLLVHALRWHLSLEIALIGFRQFGASAVGMDRRAEPEALPLARERGTPSR